MSMCRNILSVVYLSSIVTTPVLFAQRPQTPTSESVPAVAKVPQGFACIIHGNIPVVALDADTDVQVSAGALTEKHVNAIKTKLGKSFIAFQDGGHDYVITDPLLVMQALTLFQPIPDPKDISKPQGEVSAALASNATAKEAEQARKIKELQNELGLLHSQVPGPEFVALKAIPRGAQDDLQALIAKAKDAGKVTPLEL